MVNDVSLWKRFFAPKEQVHKHWYSPLDNFDFPVTEFYQRIETELQARKVPGLAMSRIDLSEGGLLSEKREYLRLKRERLVFDICAAPFGTSYFFSFRFVELPLRIKAIELLIFFVGIFFIFMALRQMFGTILGFFALVGLLGVGMYIMRNSLALGLKSLDATLLTIPVLGALYESFFRKETYYREDTRLMYLSIVDTITKELVDDVTAAKGIKLVKRFERLPKGGEEYLESANSSPEVNPFATVA